MEGIFGDTQPWIGLLDAVGVLAVLAVLYAVRDATGPVRGAVSAAGAVFVGSALLQAFGRVAGFASYFAFLQPGDGRVDRLTGDAGLILLGLVLGVLAVLTAHRRAAEAAEDLADDALVGAADEAVAGEERDDEGEDEPDDGDDDPDDGYTLRRRRLVATAPWVDLAALAVALALPVFRIPTEFGLFRVHRDVTVTIAILHLLQGITLAAPLLVLALRRDLADLRVVLAAFGLVAVRVVVMPVWPRTFANEFWGAFAAGLAVGLLAAAALALLPRAIPADRPAIVGGALVALAVVVGVSVAAARAQRVAAHLEVDNFLGGDDVGVDQGDGGQFVVPTDFPTNIPSEFLNP